MGNSFRGDDSVVTRNYLGRITDGGCDVCAHCGDKRADEVAAAMRMGYLVTRGSRGQKGTEGRIITSKLALAGLQTGHSASTIRAVSAQLVLRPSIRLRPVLTGELTFGLQPAVASRNSSALGSSAIGSTWFTMGGRAVAGRSSSLAARALPRLISGN